MIIDITKSGYQKGYLPKKGVGVFHPFFATANAAFRKEALVNAGEFDTHCKTGEDIDISIRVAKAGYELWFEPVAKIVHHHRYTLRGLLKQWYNYGLGHAYLFKKHSRWRRLQFYRYDLSGRNPSPFGIACVLSIPFPVYGMIFLSSYHFMHLFVLITIIAFLFSWVKFGILSIIGLFACAGCTPRSAATSSIAAATLLLLSNEEHFIDFNIEDNLFSDSMIIPPNEK